MHSAVFSTRTAARLLFEAPGPITALFNSLSPEVAGALRLHLGLPGESPRSRVVCELRALSETCRAAARAEVLAVARLRFRLTRPEWTAQLPQWSTSDVLVRLYLESRASFVEAQRTLLLFARGELEQRHANYVAEVVPSLDRRAQMQRVLIGLLQETEKNTRCLVREFSGEHELAMFAGHSAACARPEPMSGRLRAVKRYRLALLFHYETATILVKAPSQRERHELCHGFASIFARDPRYFERPLSRLASGRIAGHLLYKT